MQHEVSHETVEGSRILEVQPVIAAFKHHLQEGGAGAESGQAVTTIASVL